MGSPQLHIYCPEGFSPERTYAIDSLFRQFLGLDHKLIPSPKTEHYRIEFNNSTIIIEDHFFNQQDESVGYISLSNIPKSIVNYSSKDFNTKEMPVIYGLPEVKMGNKEIICKIDLFASSFFMLTRWEEQITPVRDEHGRFPATASLACKHNFLNKPVVNEYATFLLCLLQKIAPGLRAKERSFECIPTHDIDHLFKWGNLTQIRKKLAHDFITKKRFVTGIKNAYDALKTTLHLKQDPYQSFKYIVDLSKKNNLTSRFYFMAGGNSPYDLNYALEDAQPIIKYLQEQNQVIGLHPSYNSYNDPKQWAEEKEALEKIAGQPIQESRQHYLRFDVPKTWEIINANGMVTDSTVGYAKYPGFRCGSCYPFYVFDLVNRKKLDLVENPLILMETTLINHMQLKPKEANEVAKNLYFTIKKYNGNFTFLWHNSAMHTIEDLPYLHIYENIIKGFPEDAA